MARKGLIAELGEVMQLAFVPDDFDATLKHWTEVMGVGPFFLIENIQLGDMKYRGTPTEAVFTLALAYWGDMQIELIRPENDAASIYSGEYAATEGTHHVCILVDDIGKARETCAENGAEVVLEGKFGASEVIYVDPGKGTGHLIEILQQDKSGPDLFGIIKAASVGWDGNDPVRTLG
jgi:catechol 2,3-dioxygenase-like lactoylglutathione lyase family enzyme